MAKKTRGSASDTNLSVVSNDLKGSNSKFDLTQESSRKKHQSGNDESCRSKQKHKSGDSSSPKHSIDQPLYIDVGFTGI